MRKGYPCQLIVSVLIVGLLVALSGGAMAAEVPRIQGELTIFSAASLTDAFKEMAAQIEQANPSTKLTFNFAGSPTLRTQLAQGARACIESVLSPAGQAILAHHGFLVAGS
jgi:molybdate transport system substrate-binding protein